MLACWNNLVERENDNIGQKVGNLKKTVLGLAAKPMDTKENAELFVMEPCPVMFA